jgi:sulfite reductase alpha subunit-like flavoprotein
MLLILTNRLKKSLPANLLEGASFAMFCLGDRAYGPQFCAAGRKLAVRLMQLGMKTKCEVGYGDDNTPNGGCFADLDGWIQKQLLVSLEEHKLPEGNGKTTSSTPLDLSRYQVTVMENKVANSSSQETKEWQRPEFAEFYRAYFSHQGPMTAYTYHGVQRQNNPSTADSSDLNNPLLAYVECNDRLTAPDWEQNTRHIRLRVTASGDAISNEGNAEDGPLHYQAGDIATILPSNPPSEVERFINTLPESIQAMVDQQLDLTYMANGDDSSNSESSALLGGAYPHWPQQCTLRGWLTYCADIHSLPEREDLRVLSLFCSPEHPMYQEQRDKLFSLSETSESALYADYVLREKRGWGEVFYDFDSLRHSGSLLTVQALLALLPPIRPRDFSIASSPSQELLAKKQSGDSNNSDDSFLLELCVAVVEGKTPLGRKYHGLCSHYLSQVQANKSCLRLWIRPGSFAGLPLAPHAAHGSGDNTLQYYSNPVLYIGAGTGVAPLRGLILEREAVRRLAQNNGAVADNETEISSAAMNLYDDLLIFGCRKEEVDFYYETDWNRLHKAGLLYLLPAFSRKGAKKVYVQHLVKPSAHGPEIMKHILENDGAIYIAGNPSMARYSKEELLEATASLLGESGDRKANILFKKMQAKGRLSVEAWS